MVASQYGDIQKPNFDEETTVKAFVKDYFGFDYDFLGVVAAAIVGWALLFAFIFAFAIKAFNFQRR